MNDMKLNHDELIKQGLVKADDSKKIVYVDVDLTQVKRIRNGRPYTQLRRPELYA